MASISTYLKDINIDSPIVISSLVTTDTKIAQVQIGKDTVDIYGSDNSCSVDNDTIKVNEADNTIYVDHITKDKITDFGNYLSASEASKFAPASISSTVAENYLSASEASKFAPASISSTVAENYLSASQSVDFAPASISSTVAENYLSASEFSSVSADFLTDNDITGKVDKFTAATDLNLDNYTLGEYLLKLANRLSGGGEA